MNTETPTETKPITPHSLIAKIFHWGFIVIFAYAIAKQVGNVTDLNDTTLLRFEMVFAIGFLILLAVRYAFMQMTRPTALPDDTPVLVKRMARAGHLAMYVSLAMIAISGLMIGGLFMAGFETGLLISTAIGLHEVSSMASYGFIALHVLAALYHRFKGDGIWSAMVPVWTEKG